MGSDGGLMPVAEALHKPGVCLFANTNNPNFRLSYSSKLQSIYNRCPVSDIAPDVIIAKLDQVVNNA